MHFLEEKKSYVITFVIGIVAAVIICLAKEIYIAEDFSKALSILCDAFFIPGVVFLGIGIMAWIANEGLFNGIIFGLKTLGRSFSAKKGEKIREEDFYQYNDRMKEKQISFGHFMFAGIIDVVISIICLVFYLL